MLQNKRFLLILMGVLFWGITVAQNDAQISADAMTYNFGTISEAEGPATHVFTVKNTGNKPLVITRITASCGCARPEWSKEPIAPGKTSEVKITFDPKGRPGPFHKTVSIYSNGKKGSFTLSIRGNVKPKAAQPVFTYPYSIGELKLHTKTILFSSIREGEAMGERINIMNDSQKSLSILLGKMPNYFTVEVNPATLQPGETGEITILLDAKVAKRKGRIVTELPVTLSTSDEKEVLGEIKIAANIIDNFTKLSPSEKTQAPMAQLSGTIIEFGQVTNKSSIIPLIGGKVTGTFEIKNTGKSPLIIYSVTSDDERLDISGGKRELKPGASTTFKVSLRPKDVKAKLESLINVVCNDPNGPVRLIKVTAHK
ncbi:DUF1573 domain-containing protein [Parabacteroides sp. PF5-9]|uniref:DUF1573 domain-containing protein n=1 Tax=Parabacteroides sp. PF5-9 TaxID=1742404 RepID=UPI002476A8D3|nr:DUF1573 domain-containing protein [Parabacteroides sp. PF5-9]MDH6357118.1 archaellum component FlaG (FlaF/FlaG flagellin family) [Parabacteroides sp. PF5-9]